jgi:hypothetical protein
MEQQQITSRMLKYVCGALPIYAVLPVPLSYIFEDSARERFNH